MLDSYRNKKEQSSGRIQRKYIKPVIQINKLDTLVSYHNELNQTVISLYHELYRREQQCPR